MAENQYGKKLISWGFTELPDHERSRSWYIIAIIIAVLLLIYAVVAANFLFAMIIVITAVILFLRTSSENKKVDFAIYEGGLRVGNKFYEFNECDKFYIIYEPPEVKNLYLTFKSLLQPRTQVPLADINPLRVREILLDYLEEDLDQENEPLSDAVGRMFKL